MSALTVPASVSDHVAGALDAPVVLIEYGDFECPHCGRAHPIVQAAQRQLGKDLALVFRHFPLAEIHPHALIAAQASEAADAQGQFWAMHDMLFEHQSALEERDLVAYAGRLDLDVTRFTQELATRVHTRKVRDDFRSGVRSGVNGTPTFFVNGARFDGNWEEPGALVGVLASMAADARGSRPVPSG